ncbi:MAG: glycosyltransferase [Prosthecochloris sp.]|nr:glycosyltransferase [Prosthecochloris sp.]
MKNIVILGGARDYHAMDWYRAVRQNISDKKLSFLTDLMGGEGFDIIAKDDDEIEKLFIIDKFLFSKQSKLGNIWRNIFKLSIMPLQVYRLKKHAKRNPNTIYHAHPMYYMFLCWLAGVEFVGTPQGSEILIRPYRSKIYRYFAVKSLQAAKYITVDSVSMKDKIYELSSVEAIVVQNGIDMEQLLKYSQLSRSKDKIVSIRGMTGLYRIDEIVTARNRTFPKLPLTFIYPFMEDSYRVRVKKKLIPNDVDLGRLDKEQMYKLLSESKLVISIPKSDSSPRSVYEAIFLGACVAIRHNNYYEVLPLCMKERIFIIDFANESWLKEAIAFADKIKTIKYHPSKEALEMFDQNISMKKMIDKLY